MDILEIFRQAIKGGGDRLANQFAPVTEQERMANMQRRPNMPGYQTPAGADSIAGRFAGQFPTQDDMQRHRGSGYTVPDAVRRGIMSGHDAGRDYGYEGPGQYPADVVDRVLIEEEMRRRNRAMPGSPVNY
jgi:hypothetical protein|tara:strand:- start:1348 stop:1740 length:393 start_codon:yes stop_codon:yes gene_type:complete